MLTDLQKRQLIEANRERALKILTQPEREFLVKSRDTAAKSMTDIGLGMGPVAEAMTMPCNRPNTNLLKQEVETHLRLIARAVTLNRLVSIFWPKNSCLIIRNSADRAMIQLGLAKHPLAIWIDLDYKDYPRDYWSDRPDLVNQVLQEIETTCPGLVERIGITN